MNNPLLQRPRSNAPALERHRKWLGLVGMLLLLGLFGVGCNSPASEQGEGQLEVRIWDHREAIGDFDELWLTLSLVGIHPAGQPRTEGWIELEPSVQKLDLTDYLDGRDVVVLKTTVKAGSYNAIRLVVDEATGLLLDGQLAELKVDFETAALDFRVRGGQTTMIGLDLMVLDMSDHPSTGSGQGPDSRYELHLREATTR